MTKTTNYDEKVWDVRTKDINYTVSFFLEGTLNLNGLFYPKMNDLDRWDEV